MRRSDREVKDSRRIAEIISKAKYLHLGMVEEGRPYVVPLHFGYEGRDPLVFYMHSAKEGRKLDVLKKNPAVCLELETEVELLPGPNACSFSSSYASLIGWGNAVFVTDEGEKAKALSLIMKNQTGKEYSFTKDMADSVAIIKVVLEEYSVKCRPLVKEQG